MPVFVFISHGARNPMKPRDKSYLKEQISNCFDICISHLFINRLNKIPSR